MDANDFAWRNIGPAFLGENMDRGVLWICKKYPTLSNNANVTSKRVEQSFDAMTVSLRLIMFHVYFYKATCQGMTTQERANRYDRFFGQVEPEEFAPSVETEGSTEELTTVASAPALSFTNFRNQIINVILTVDAWTTFFAFVGIKCPESKEEMEKLLRLHLQNSFRKKYHNKGMDFSRVQASGTSTILSKGQQYSASASLRRVLFKNVWNYEGETTYLDATCLLYAGHNRLSVVDFANTSAQGVVHSGDLMRVGGGTHTIHIDLQELDPTVDALVFVISAFEDATLADILSPSISFTDSDANDDAEALCTYDLDSQDKVSYLTSVIICKLYRVRGGGWHVQAIGDAHKGAADDYGPIFKAVGKLS